MQNPISAAPDSTLEYLTVWLDFISDFAWPLVVLTGLLLYRPQILRLIERVKSGEVAGAKFDFSEAATNFISASVDTLADEQDPRRREQLARGIKDVAGLLGGIHPIALGILISGAQNQMWVGQVYEEKKRYFDDLENAGLAAVNMRTRENGWVEVRIRLTFNGRAMLRSLGFGESELPSE